MLSPAAGRRRAVAATAVVSLTGVAVTAVTATALWSATAQADDADLGTDSGTSSGTVPDTTDEDSAPVTPGLESAPDAQSSGS
ncbi:hypothetical protein AB1046_01375 [Promicromonospora sp. Populi]|uniref:hypothetical protein n=1 Tax=Promicromonospora sp. Populi TaxID=3239420 RepID=UPI0034E2B6D2